MRSANVLRTIGVVGLVAVLLATVGTVLSQTPGDNPTGAEPELEAPALPPGEETLDREKIEEPAAVEYILAQPPYTMNYQGYLTDGGGSPLDGTYDLVFSLYDDPNAGASEWGPETHLNVPVTNGIFQVALGSSVTLYPNDFDEALFLAVTVDGISVTPRQPLHSVPYAFGLVPGAEVEGDPGGANFALSVTNLGTGSNDSGVYARGERWGLYAEEVGTESDVGIYTPDFVFADGYRSSEDSYLWVPGTASEFYPSAGCTAWPQYHGSVRVECSAAGTYYINFPITVPAVLFGQSVRVEDIRVFYRLVSADSYISATRLRRLTQASGSVSVINDDTDRKSTVSSSYSLLATENYTLTAESGALNLNLTIIHDGSTTNDVYIGGVRVRLRHYDEP